jgi:hypothetical protein
MKRLFACACIAATLGFGACGNDPATAPTPQPAVQETPAPGGGVIAPADRARNTVDRLNEQQDQMEQQTGSGY